MAVGSRKPAGVIHHSDQGSQYTSFAFGKRCREAGVRPSMGSVGDAYDNAMAESFFATLECELLDRRRFKIAFERRHAQTVARMQHDGRRLPAAPSLPSCSRPSRTSPPGRANYAPLTARSARRRLLTHGPGRKDEGSAGGRTKR